MTGAADAAERAGRVGPNAVIQVAAALRGFAGAALASEIFSCANLAAYAASGPAGMVREDEVAALHHAVRAALAPAEAAAVLRDAGLRTGDYLLAHRIPRPAQAILKILPGAIACRILLAAIRRHAWTFAGSGAFRADAGNPAVVEIRGCPLCRGETSDEPLCGYYAAVFERLFQALVSPRAKAAETGCEAMGALACHFEIAW